MATFKRRCCRMCKFHHVYCDERRFAGCECRAWDDPENRDRYHTCGRGNYPESSMRAGTNCPRFVFFPPEEYLD